MRVLHNPHAVWQAPLDPIGLSREGQTLCISALPTVAITEESLSQNITSSPSSTSNSNPTPNPPKSPFDIIKEELGSGKIPQELAEEMRLVPFESIEGQKFHNAVLEFIKPLYQSSNGRDIRYGTHDFDKEPVKFILSKSGVSNACRIRYTDPSTVVIDAAMFEAQGNKEALIANNADLAYILIHEISHGKLRKEFGEDVSNSKIEEGAFYSIPIQLLHANGIDPQLGQNTIKKIAKFVKRETKKAELYKLFIDDHPLPENIEKIASDTKAFILKEKGKHEYKSFDLSISQGVLDPIHRGVEQRYLTSRIAAISGFESLTAFKKIEALGQILETMQDYYPVRIFDLLNELKKIQIKPDPDLKKAANVFVNKVLDARTKLDNSGPLEMLLLRVSRLVNPSVHEIEPMGRLAIINDQAKALIKANNTLLTLSPKASEWKQAEEVLIEAAQSFNRAIEAEPLAKTYEGRQFLQIFNWSQFEFPNTDQIKKLKPAISWSPMRYLAINNTDVLKAGFIMGLDKDPGMYEAIRYHDYQVGLDFYSEDSSKNRLVPSLKFQPISKGPTDESNSRIEDLVIESSNNRVKAWCIDFNNLPDHPSLPGSHLYEAHNANIKYLIDICINLGTKEAEDKAVSLCGKMVQSNDNEIKFSDYALSNFNFVFRANAIELEHKSLVAGQAFINIFDRLIQEKGDEGRTIVRQFYGLDSPAQNFWQEIGPHQFQSNPNPWNLGFKQADEEDDSESVTHNILNELKQNPFMKFVLNDKYQIFNLDEKKTIINLLNCKDSALFGINDKNTATETLGYFSPYFPDIDKLKTIDQTFDFLKQQSGIQPFDTYIGQLKLLILACQETELSLDTSFSVTRASENSNIMECSDLTQVLRFSVNKNFAEVLKPSTLNKAVEYWIEFTNQDLFNPGKSIDYLESILQLIKEVDPQSIKEYSQLLLASNQIKLPSQREQLMGLWSESILAIHGQDTGGDDYLLQVKPNINWVLTDIHRSQQSKILQTLVSKLQAQEALCQYTAEELKRHTIQLKDFDYVKEKGIAIEGLLHFVKNHATRKKPILDFLIKPYNLSSVGSFVKKFARFFLEREFNRITSSSNQFDQLDEDYSVTKNFRKDYEKEFNTDYEDIFHDENGFIEELTDYISVKDFFSEVKAKATVEAKELYYNFGAAPLSLRAVITRELLLSRGQSQNAIFDKAIKTMIKAETKDADQIRALLKEYINALDPSQRYLALSAMMVACPRVEEEELRIGQALALFAENMGPAETKLGQCAESHPKVPADIRKDLKRLKYRADEPYRWLIVKQIKELNNQILDSYNLKADKKNVQDLDQHDRIYIKRIGEVLGCGSLFVAVELEMSDGKKQVIAIKRPDARERAVYGFETLCIMINNLKPGKIKDTLTELVHNAKAKLDIEVDCLIADEQYSTANKLYKDAFIVVNGRKVYFESPLISASGGGFYMMDKLEGEHFAEAETDSKITDSVKKDASMAILIMELHNIFNGQFCNDRHGGNTKVRPLDGDESSLMIGHIDFKALAIKPWTQEGYDQFAEILVQMVLQLHQIKSADDFVNMFLDIQSSIRDRGDTIQPFVSEVQKALLSNSEYARNLNAEDLGNVLLSAISNGMNTQMQSAIHKQVEKLPFFIKPIVSNFIEKGEIPISGFTPMLIQRAA